MLGGIPGWQFDPDHAQGRAAARPKLGTTPAGEPFPHGIDGARADVDGWVLQDDAAIDAARRRAVRAVGRASTAGIPALDASGHVPEGLHVAARGELLARFATNARRMDLAHRQLPVMLDALSGAGVHHVVLGGSFVSAKAHPGDVDLAWLPRPGVTTDGVEAATRAIAHIAPDVNVHRADRIVQNAPDLANATPGWNFLELFQHDRTGAPHGALLLPTVEPLEATGAAIREVAAKQALNGLRMLARV
jgi:hypothetical protein